MFRTLRVELLAIPTSARFGAHGGLVTKAQSGSTARAQASLRWNFRLPSGKLAKNAASAKTSAWCQLRHVRSAPDLGCCLP
jgi:hypothetical protein